MIDKIKQHKWLILSSSLALVFFITIIILLTISVSRNEYIKIFDELNSKKKEYSQIKTAYGELNNKVKEQENKINELNQKEKQEQINKNINDLEIKVTELTNTKNALQQEIDSLNEEVIKTKGEPKTYPAGHLIAGTDVPTGKYKIFGGHSNFVVRSATGRLEVNIILGTSYGVDEYIYTFKKGDNIEADSSFKLIEIEQIKID